MRAHIHLSSICVLLGANAALAQTAEDDFLGTIVLDYSGVNEVGVDGDDLETIEPDDLQDVFKNEPTVQVGSSLPISQKIYVQGIEENNLAVTIDGSRQNNKIFHHNATTYIDPVMLKQVRIDPGVAPADGGPGEFTSPSWRALCNRCCRDVWWPRARCGYQPHESVPWAPRPRAIAARSHGSGPAQGLGAATRPGRCSPRRYVEHGQGCAEHRGPRRL